MRVLLTNDDGIEAEGIHVLRRTLAAVPGIEVVTIAPDGNRSAIGRGITTRRPLLVERIDFGDGTHGFATDGTPVDCVRLASLGLVEGFAADMVVAGINHGTNLGDDVTYSGTVAAAFEGLILGLPAIAVSQQSEAGEMDFRAGEHFVFDHVARFVARVVEELQEVPMPEGTLLNVNGPGGREPAGVTVARLGKRIYRDRLELEGEADGRHSYWIYGTPDWVQEDDTDLAAIAAGEIAVTPLHLDVTSYGGLEGWEQRDLARLLGSASRSAGGPLREPPPAEEAGR